MFKPNKKSMLLRNGYKLIAVFVIALFSVITFTSVPVEAKPTANFQYKDFDWNSFYEQNQDHWDDKCPSSDEECSKKLLKMQKKFYKKMYALLGKYEKKGVYSINDENYAVLDDLILQTVFYNITPSQMTDSQTEYNEDYITKGNGLFAMDDADFEGDEVSIADDESNDYFTDESVLRYYEDETDSLKILVKNLIAHTTDCYGILGDPKVKEVNGEKQEYCEEGFLKSIPYRTPLLTYKTKCVESDSHNELGFWIFYTSKAMHDLEITFRVPESLGDILFMKKKFTDEYYESCKANADYYPEGTVYMYNKDLKLSFDLYFDFLSNNKYFDNKGHLQDLFKETVLDPAGVECMTDKVCDNSLEASGKYDEYEDAIIKVRQKIIKDIISILQNYGFDIDYTSENEYDSMEEASEYVVRKSYYWPIGSDETEERNGIVYADGEPASTEVISGYGERVNPLNGEDEFHYGIDIKGVDGETNVVAVYPGTVVSIYDGCTTGDTTCNEGYGNTIILSHSNGDYTVYAHLASIDSSVVVGGNVDKGQVIGKVGQTGDATEPCLHYELRKGGNSIDNAVNPLDTMSADAPRPEISLGEFPVHGTSLTREEFIAFVEKYGRSCNSSNTTCSEFKQYFLPNAGKIYDISVSIGLNPELVIVRGLKEGMSPGGSTYNFWGIGCVNKHSEKCEKFSSLEAGIKRFAKVVNGYDSVVDMMKKYAYIGDYWYTPGSWSDGGCIYYNHIKNYLSSSRQQTVASACSKSNCPNGGTSGCLKTTDEDQSAYAAANSQGMIDLRYQIFGL